MKDSAGKDYLRRSDENGWPHWLAFWVCGAFWATMVLWPLWAK